MLLLDKDTFLIDRTRASWRYEYSHDAFYDSGEELVVIARGGTERGHAQISCMGCGKFLHVGNTVIFSGPQPANNVGACTAAFSPAGAGSTCTGAGRPFPSGMELDVREDHR